MESICINTEHNFDIYQNKLIDTNKLKYLSWKFNFVQDQDIVWNKKYEDNCIILLELYGNVCAKK